MESGWCLWLLLPDGKVEQGWMMEARTPPTPDSNHFHAQAPPICGSSPSVHPGCTIERWCSLWLMHYGTTSKHPPLHPLASSGLCWRPLAFVGVLWPSLASSGLRWRPLAFAGVLWPSLVSSGLCWRPLAFVGVLWPSLAAFGI